MKELLKKHRMLIAYAVFGVLTTAVNYLCALFFSAWFARMGITASWPSVSMAWLLSVLFAYGTNRIWVFRSQARDKEAVLRELLAFFGARLFSGILEVALMTLLVDRMGYPFDVTKLLCNVLVIVLNYVLSKSFIFKPRQSQMGQAPGGQGKPDKTEG